MGYKSTFDCERTFGVEFEVFGPPRIRIERYLGEHDITSTQVEFIKYVIPTWRLSNDNSIIGENPTEIASPLLKGREGLAEVEKVCTALQLAGCQVNWSCGFHVHWSAQDYTGKNVLSLLRLYAKFENVIDYLVSPSRRGDRNKYCRSMVKDTDLAWVTELDKTERARAVEVALNFGSAHSEWTMPHTERMVQRSSRYHKLNISAYNHYGTVEFRQHQGTLNANKATNWIVFTQQLVNKAKYVAVSRDPSAKPTLGEMLRVLRLVDFQLIEDRCTDPLIIHLGEWMKGRYRDFCGGLEE